MRRTHKVTSEPALEPVTLEEAKAWAKIDSTADDALVTSLITAARVAAENYTRRSLINQTIRLTLDLDGCGREPWWDGVREGSITELLGGLPYIIELPKPPVSSITSVTTYDLDNDSTVFSSSNYYLNSDGYRLVLKQSASWPSSLRPVGAVEILYVAGYGSLPTNIPQPIRTAILMHIQAMYDSRIECDMPANCKMLLNQYRIMDGLSA